LTACTLTIGLKLKAVQLKNEKRKMLLSQMGAEEPAAKSKIQIKIAKRESMKSLKKYSLVLLFMVHSIPGVAVAQMDSLRRTIEQIVGCAEGKIGVALQGLENNDTLTIDGNGKYPMQSVYKFPLALAVLSQVDKGTLSLDQQIYLKKSDLLPNTWSPLREKHPQGNINVCLDELLSYTVTESDNNGCDILFRLIGGTDVVDQYVHHLGITNIAIATTEEEMHKDWNVQYTNWSTPAAMCQLLRMFYQDSILSRKSQDYLWHAMESTETGPGRIKGLLPPGTIVAHKTGSSGTNDLGIAAATNDAGIVALPNGKHVALVVFVSDSPADEKTRDNFIARIAKAVWDTFSVQ
jgi:beta-lactamase class A